MDDGGDILITDEDKKLIEEGITLDQKFAKALIVLKWLRPFYSSVYEVMNKVPSESIPTMGVSSNEFFYNVKFSEKLPFSEFMFVILHEVGHIALMHAVRIKDRDPKLWNVACDLYVNKLLYEEFCLGMNKSNAYGAVNYRSNITMPDEALFFNNIDIDNDSVDSIYDDLYNQAKSNGYFADIAASEVVDNGGLLHKEYNFKLRRKGGEYNFKIDKNYVLDVFPAGENDNKLQEEAKARQLISEAQIRNELCNRSTGSDPGGLERLCKKLMESKLNWKKILKKYLIENQQTDVSFTKPDKRMYWQDAVYPGPSPSPDGSLKDVKICIDTSGSISENDLAEFIGHLRNLFKQYKVDAELIYWDAKVQSAGSIKGIQDVKKVSILGGGGTNPSCIFEYLDNKRARVITTIVLTDGYFGFDENSIKGTKWAKKYKNTIWIICRNGFKGFKAPFGKVTEYDEGV